MAGAPEPVVETGGLAFQDRRRPDKAQIPLPINTMMVGY